MTVLTPLNTNLDSLTDLARQKIVERQAETIKPGQSREQLHQAAKEFESMFMAEMLQPLFEGVGKTDGIFGGGHGEAIFKTLMVQEYGKIMAERGGLGIAKQIEARYGTEVTQSSPEPEPVTKLESKLPKF